MAGSFVANYCHMVFSTKNRVPQIDDELRPRLFEYMGGTMRGLDGVLLAAGGTADQVHLLVSMGKEGSIASTIRDIKSNSSGWIHETFPERHEFAWQSGYGAFSVSHSRLDRVKEYLVNQRQHHRVKTFKEEFEALLRKHHIKFDERYIWE